MGLKPLTRSELDDSETMGFSAVEQRLHVCWADAAPLPDWLEAVRRQTSKRPPLNIQPRGRALTSSDGGGRGKWLLAA